MEIPKLKVALDLGVGSIGVAIGYINKSKQVITNSLKTFVHIYKPASSSNKRREQRLSRRLLRFRKKRKQLLWKYLSSIAQSNFFIIKPFVITGKNKIPLDTNYLRFSKKTIKKDVLYLRYKGVNSRLSPMELGYLLYYLCGHRGSNNINVDVRKKYQENHKTIGESLYLHRKQTQNSTKEKCLKNYYILGTKKKKDLCKNQPNIDNSQINTTRNLVIQEIKDILQYQRRYYCKYITSEIIDNIIKIIDFEKDSKIKTVRKCIYFPKEDRLRLSSYYSEKKRITEFCTNLRLKVRYDLNKNNKYYISNSAFRSVYSHLMMGIDLGENQIKQLIGPIMLKNGDLTLEYDISGYKHGTTISGHLIAKLKGQEFFAKLNDTELEYVLDYYLSCINKRSFLKYLQNIYLLDSRFAESILQFIVNCNPKRGFSKLGESATKIVIKSFLKKEASSQQCAINNAIKNGLIKEANLHKYNKLPHYSKVLKEFINNQKIISNSVVDKTLNRVRKVINEIIYRYGSINEIIIEYSKSLANSFKIQDSLTLNNYIKEQENKLLIKELAKYGHSYVTQKNVLLYKLCKQQNMVCPYSGCNLGVSQIFDGTLEIDHIIPYAISYDNTINNLVATTSYMNQKKGKRTPYEAFFGSEYWNNIIGFLQNNKDFVKHKGWRFQEDALKIFQEKSIFSPRYKTDNSFVANVTVKYLKCLFSKDKQDNVKSIKSSFVGVLRKYWGLNNITYNWNKNYINEKDKLLEHYKNRVDVRHNALDALILWVFDEKIKSLLKLEGISKDNQDNLYWCMLKNIMKNNNKNVVDVKEDLSFRFFISKILEDTNISFHVRKKLNGQLHKDTIYRLYKNNSNDNSYVLGQKKKNFNIDDIRNWNFQSNATINNQIKREVCIPEGIMDVFNDNIIDSYNCYLNKIFGHNYCKIHNLFKNYSNKNTKDIKKTWIEVLNLFWENNKKGYLKFINYKINKLLVIKYPNNLSNMFGYGYILGNNFCLDLYYEDSKLKGEIIRKYQILTIKNYQPLYVRNGLKRVERLFNGDILELDFKDKDKYLSCLFTGSKNKKRIRVRITAFTETENSIELHLKLLHKSGYSKDFAKNLNSLKKLNIQKLILSTLGFEKYRSNTL